MTNHENHEFVHIAKRIKTIIFIDEVWGCMRQYGVVCVSMGLYASVWSRMRQSIETTRHWFVTH